jgi:hypothetical protein
MRVSRGLFRLWVVLSVLWVGFVAASTWSTFPAEDWIVAERFVDVPQIAPQRHGTESIDGEWGAAAPEYSPETAKAAKQAADPWSGSGIKFMSPEEYAESQNEKSLAARGAERRNALRVALLWASVPPALAFAFGLASIWVVRGFRS